MVEYACYSEVLKLGLKVCAIKNSWIKKWCWVLFYVVHWIVIAEDVKNSQLKLECVPILAFLIKYNMAVGLISYLILIVTFVLSMSKKHYLNRYTTYIITFFFSPLMAGAKIDQTNKTVPQKYDRRREKE